MQCHIPIFQATVAATFYGFLILILRERGFNGNAAVEAIVPV